jgi:acylphosphatase
VEVVASGHPGALDALEASLAEGPRHARVTGVEKLEISDEIDICKSFEIR